MATTRRIGLDGLVFVLQRSGGVSRYLRELACGLTVYPDIKPELIAFSGWQANVHMLPGAHSLSVHETRWRVVGWPMLDWPEELKAKYDIIHSPYLNLPFRSPKGRVNVLTVHDLILHNVLIGPRSWMRMALFEAAIRRADHIVCVSHYTCRRLVDARPELLKSSRISVIHNGITERFARAEFGRTDLGRPYLLFLGARVFYKGFKDLLQAFATMHSFKDLMLVCAGGGAFSKAEQSELRGLGLAGRVTWIGNIDDTALGSLYKGAFALVYPSIEEGFGIPPIEAMSCQCPVIARDIPVIREVTGRIPWYLKAFTAEGFQRVLHEISEGGHEARLAAGRAHALNYTWAKSVENHAKLYRQLL